MIAYSHYKSIKFPIILLEKIQVGMIIMKIVQK